MSTTSKSYQRALAILERCKREGKTIAELAHEDGYSRNNYHMLLKNHNLLAEYKKVKPLSMAKVRLLESLDRAIESKKPQYVIDRREEMIKEAKALIERCVATNTAISNLARQDGYTPRSYILKLTQSGLYSEYKTKMGVNVNQYRARQSTIDGARAIIERCKNLELPYHRLAELDGVNNSRVYHDRLVAAGLYQDYLAMRRTLRILRITAKLEAI